MKTSCKRKENRRENLRGNSGETEEAPPAPGPDLKTTTTGRPNGPRLRFSRFPLFSLTDPLPDSSGFPESLNEPLKEPLKSVKVFPEGAPEGAAHRHPTEPLKGTFAKKCFQIVFRIYLPDLPDPFQNSMILTRGSTASFPSQGYTQIINPTSICF